MTNKVDADHAANLASHLLMQREIGKYCDVCICVEDKRFLAHKCILSANSPKLDTLIMDAIGQSSSNHDIEIEIQGVSSVGFETLLEYFYTGDLSLKTDTVMPVWMTAAYLELPGVVKLCTDFCQHSVTCVSSQLTDDATKVSDVSSNQTNDVFASSVEEPIEVSVVSSASLSDAEFPNPDDEEVEPNKKSTTVWTSLQNATGGDFDPSNETRTTKKQKWVSQMRTARAKSSIKEADTNKNTNPLKTQLRNDDAITTSSSVVKSSNSSLDTSKQIDARLTSKPGCEDMMMEVERLRIQHEQLQRLQQQQHASFNPSSASGSAQPQKLMMVLPAIPDVGPPKKKSKVKSSPSPITEASKHNDAVAIKITNIPQHPHPTLSPASSSFTRPSSQHPVDFIHITDHFREELYRKYSISPETPMAATCTAAELLQKGKPRSRKSTEQNALNNTIRIILDSLSIADSSDPAVEDALILIMDRFQSLRDCVNDPIVRRNLLVKVRHSIHCKKWRIKKQMMKDIGPIIKRQNKALAIKSEVSEDSLHG